MHTQSALHFINTVETDAALRAELDLLGWETEAVMSVARDLGYTFSTRELQTAMDECWGEMLHEELVATVGGGNGRNGNGNGRTGTGPVDPDTYGPPPTQPGFRDGSGWAPPPGDVSGNSCFFVRG